MTAIGILIGWIVSTALALACYTHWFDDIPECGPRTVFILPFILIGDVLTLASRNRTVWLIRQALP
jgi:hypothetical protein